MFYSISGHKKGVKRTGQSVPELKALMTMWYANNAVIRMQNRFAGRRQNAQGKNSEQSFIMSIFMNDIFIVPYSYLNNYNINNQAFIDDV